MENIEIFNLLKNLGRFKLEENSMLKKASRKQLIYPNKFNDQKIYFLISGRVKLEKKVSFEHYIINDIIFPNNFFGIKSIIDGHANKESAKALSDITYLEIDREVIRKAMDENKLFNDQMCKIIYKRMIQVENRLETMHSSKNVKTRFISFLLELTESNEEGNESEIRIDIRLTHQEIAEYIFATRQTVSTIMADLKKIGLIDYDKDHIFIKNTRELINHTELYI